MRANVKVKSSERIMLGERLLVFRGFLKLQCKGAGLKAPNNQAQRPDF